MARVPASLALLALRQEADRLDREGDSESARRLRISPSTLRSWVHRGRITRTAKGYSLQEIEQYLAQRDEGQRVSA
jgi:DNA-binding transcriptional MerR regulator